MSVVRWFGDSVLKTVTGDVEQRVEKSAKKIEAGAKTYCPVKTGALKRSITSFKSKYKDTSWIIWAGGSKDDYYASFVEAGHHAADGTWVGADPFLRKALNKNKGWIRKVLGVK